MFPSFMHGIAIRYVQHCQAMLERGVCELAHSFFHHIKNKEVFVLEKLLVQISFKMNERTQ